MMTEALTARRCGVVVEIKPSASRGGRLLQLGKQGGVEAKRGSDVILDPAGDGKWACPVLTNGKCGSGGQECFPVDGVAVVAGIGR